jgi:hypothetical protein
VDNIRMDLGEVGWWDGVMWTGLVWLRIRTIRYWNIGLHEMLGNYRVA